MRNDSVGDGAIGSPQIDDRGLLALAAIREMTIACEQAQQLPKFCATTAAELPLSGLNQQLIAGLEILELDLAARRIEIMPFGRLDLIAILRHNAVNIRGGRSHESRNSRPHCNAHAFAEGPAIDGRLNVDPSVVQVADPHHSELRCQTRV